MVSNDNTVSKMDVYGLNIKTIAENEFTWIKNNMPLRYEKAMNYRFLDDRLRCLGVAFLLKGILGISTEDNICIDANGKPYVKDNKCFNVSHSGDYCIIATADKPIGIDIEKMNSDNIALAESIYAKEELEWMMVDELSRFHKLWTLKESLMKATGKGLAVEPISINVMPFINNDGIIVNGVKWYAASATIKNYAFSCCTTHPIDRLNWIEYSFSEIYKVCK